jgi:hypothetical protein
MNVRTTAKGIAEQHRLKAISKIVVKKGGEKLLNIPPKKVTKL